MGRTRLQIEQARKKALAARKIRLKKIHRMTLEQYESIKSFQGGSCPLCLRAKGVTKALAVDHDHQVAIDICDHPPNESCEDCWRGIVCGSCNTILSRMRSDPDMALRFHSYLLNPPAQVWRLTNEHSS